MNNISRLARAAAQTRWPDIPEEIRSQASDLFLDTLAVISAGLAHQEYAPFARAHHGTSGPASIPGVEHGVGTLQAALVNGGATTVLQLQDGHRLARGHPASHLVPALLAIAEAHETSCVRLLEAFVAGYEVGTRVGIALGGFNPALHDTGTWGTVGAAVGVGYLLTDGDVDALAAAIEGSAAVAPMPYRETAAAGATIHHLYIGLGAAVAVNAGQAIAAGWSPLAGTLDAFFGPRAGAAYQPAALIAGIDDHDRWAAYELLRAYIKVHPTCAHLHGVNDAVAHLIDEHALSARDVARVDVAIYAAALAFENANPTNELAARFSVPGSVAIALCRGGLSIHTLTPEALAGADVQELMRRIHVSHDRTLDQHYPEGRPCRVTVTCHDGRRLEAAVIHPRGDCTNPLPTADRRAKAQELLTVRFGERGALDVIDAWDAVVAGAPLTGLSRSLRAPAHG